MPTWVFDVKEAEFEQAVIERSKRTPVVVDFWAPWCAPCRALGPLLEKLVEERQGQVVLAKLNTDECQELASAFRIEAIPAVKGIKNGQIVLEFEGVLPEAALRDFLDRLCPSSEENEAEAAKAMEAGDPAAAKATYRRLVAGTNPPDAALVGLARVLIDQGKGDEAEPLLRRVAPGGPLAGEIDALTARNELQTITAEFPDEAALTERLKGAPEDARLRYELGCRLAGGGRYPAALEMLLSAAERDRKLGGSAVREAMVKVFQIVGVRSELADAFRDRLRSVLY